MSRFDFYSRQSLLSDPGEFAYLFDDLPSELAKIKEIIQGLIFHFWDGDLFGYKIPLARRLEVETRYVEKMLEKLMSKDSSPLKIPRPSDKKIIGSCRDYALLFCSILRHQGIPARVRVAFNLFFFKDAYHDQVIVEYWDPDKNRYCRIEPRLSEAHFKDQNIDLDFDEFDVPANRLMLAGEAWLHARKNSDQAELFYGGNREKNKGLWYIRDRLIQDIAALQGVEMQLWDRWGMMNMPDDIFKEAETLNYFDQLAQMTIFF